MHHHRTHVHVKVLGNDHKYRKGIHWVPSWGVWESLRCPYATHTSSVTRTTAFCSLCQPSFTISSAPSHLHYVGSDMGSNLGVLLGTPGSVTNIYPLTLNSSSSLWSYSSTSFFLKFWISLWRCKEAEDFGNNFIILFQSMCYIHLRFKGSELVNRVLKNYGQNS